MAAQLAKWSVCSWRFPRADTSCETASGSEHASRVLCRIHDLSFIEGREVTF